MIYLPLCEPRLIAFFPQSLPVRLLIWHGEYRNQTATRNSNEEVLCVALLCPHRVAPRNRIGIDGKPGARGMVPRLPSCPVNCTQSCRPVRVLWVMFAQRSRLTASQDSTRRLKHSLPSFATFAGHSGTLDRSGAGDSSQRYLCTCTHTRAPP